MDIKKLQPEAEVTYELETTGEPISITFRIGFAAIDAIQDYVNESAITTGALPRLSDVVRKAVSEAIHGWDLTEGDKPLSCTREAKDKYLPLLFGLKIKKAEAEQPEKPEENKAPIDPAASTIIRALIEFVGNVENFLKN